MNQCCRQCYREFGENVYVLDGEIFCSDMCAKNYTFKHNPDKSYSDVLLHVLGHCEEIDKESIGL